VLAAHVGGDIAETVDREHGRGDLHATDLRLGQVESDELRGRHGRAELARFDTRREMRRGRREDVARMEGPRDAIQPEP